MAQKLIVIADPGIDTAFAVALALHDPSLDVIGLIASAGNISADKATQNVHLMINAVDPPRWPRLGAALPVEYESDGTRLHGPDGLGNVGLPPVSLHAPTTINAGANARVAQTTAARRADLGEEAAMSWASCRMSSIETGFTRCAWKPASMARRRSSGWP